ncbi:hypothetical protein C8Q75DRAFT_812281 [Abortiporus biennis]|nr:hypothetical protein C8Q75DRAFT_812281 [Abortiporus biennis]
MPFPVQDSSHMTPYTSGCSMFNSCPWTSLWLLGVGSHSIESNPLDVDGHQEAIRNVTAHVFTEVGLTLMEEHPGFHIYPLHLYLQVTSGRYSNPGIFDDSKELPHFGGQAWHHAPYKCTQCVYGDDILTNNLPQLLTFKLRMASLPIPVPEEGGLDNTVGAIFIAATEALLSLSGNHPDSESLDSKEQEEEGTDAQKET